MLKLNSKFVTAKQQKKSKEFSTYIFDHHQYKNNNTSKCKVFVVCCENEVNMTRHRQTLQSTPLRCTGDFCARNGSAHLYGRVAWRCSLDHCCK